MPFPLKVAAVNSSDMKSRRGIDDHGHTFADLGAGSPHVARGHVDLVDDLEVRWRWSHSASPTQDVTATTSNFSNRASSEGPVGDASIGPFLERGSTKGTGQLKLRVEITCRSFIVSRSADTTSRKSADISAGCKQKLCFHGPLPPRLRQRQR